MDQNKIKINVREERPEDYRRVEEITKAAFSYPGRIEQGGIGCPYEHWMVHELRERDGILPLSLVAVVDDTIVGHIICSHAAVKTKEKRIPVLNFGPLSVLPEYQRKGVGGALLKAMMKRAKEMGFGAILFFGSPEYYPQFGFVEAAEFGVTDCNGANYPAFMAIELQPGYLSQARSGKYFESDIYDDEKNREAVKEFDEKFREEVRENEK
ncbi:MAG: N-acetyltransferase [Firmicutes bacterium]|nr:N-acetyltransferase [Bacillota bacterium]